MKTLKNIFVFLVICSMFVVMIFIYSINYLVELVSIILIIVTEHLLMAAAILFVLYSGYKELKVHRNRALDRIMAGYSMFCICSVFALGCFYFGNSVMYSVSSKYNRNLLYQNYGKEQASQGDFRL